MDFYEEVKSCLDEIQGELENARQAPNREEEIEALKEMLDGFMRGTQSVREHIDNFNDRRWRQ